MVAAHHLGQESEANGRRYFIAFVVFKNFGNDVRSRFEAAGLDGREPFPDKAEMCPKALGSRRGWHTT